MTAAQHQTSMSRIMTTSPPLHVASICSRVSCGGSRPDIPTCVQQEFIAQVVGRSERSSAIADCESRRVGPPGNWRDFLQSEANSLQGGESRGDRRIALGASELSSQLRERNISKSLHGLSNVDLPRAIALTLSAKRAEHIPSMGKGREQHFVGPGYKIDCVPAWEQSPEVVIDRGRLFSQFSLLATRG